MQIKKLYQIIISSKGKDCGGYGKAYTIKEEAEENIEGLEKNFPNLKFTIKQLNF